MVHLKKLLALSLFFAAFDAWAALSPIGIGIVPPAQFPPREYSVTGIRLNLLWGRHRDVYGFDLGAVGNIVEQSMVGVQLAGVFNWNQGETKAIGAQLAGVMNYNTNKARIFGVQAALAANVNTAESSVAGLQLSLANISDHTDIYGAQVGLYNRANSVYGVQIGIVNEAANLHGLQIGLLNFHKTGLFYVSPILNFGF